MDYEQGYVYELMDQGGPTDTREPFFREAVEEMMRARTLCAKANAAMPDLTAGRWRRASASRRPRIRPRGCR